MKTKQLVKIPIENARVGMVFVRFDKVGITFSHYGVPVPDQSVIDELVSQGVGFVYIRTDIGGGKAYAVKERTAEEVTAAQKEEKKKPAQVKKKPVIGVPRVELEDLQDKLDGREYERLVKLNEAQNLHLAAKREMKNQLKRIKSGFTFEAANFRSLMNDLVFFANNNPRSLMNAVRTQFTGDYDCTHAVNVSILAMTLGSILNMGPRDISLLGLSGLLHDIGQVRVDDSILSKPGALTNKELMQVRKHPEWGYEMLSRIPGMNKRVLAGVLSHHERADGSGYPNGLVDRQIDVFGQIIGICDVFDAATSDKAYAPGRPKQEVIKMLFSMKGTGFKPAIVMGMIKLLGPLPVGSTVQLDTKEIAVVYDINAADLNRPKILVCTNARGGAVAPTFYDLLTGKSGKGVLARKKIVRVLDPARVGISPNAIIDAWIATNM